MGIRTSHIVAAFIGVIAFAYIRYDGGLPPGHDSVIVFWGAVIFGLGWEGIVRLSAALK